MNSIGSQAQEEHHEHASIKTYYKIAVILTIVTVVEVIYPYATEGIPSLDAFYMPLLGVMSLFKFVLVCGYFMHLKYDSKILRHILVFSLFVATLMTVALMLLFGIGI